MISTKKQPFNVCFNASTIKHRLLRRGKKKKGKYLGHVVHYHVAHPELSRKKKKRL